MSDKEQFSVAIIGVGCRFPGGIRDMESFWDVLINGRDTIAEWPEMRMGPLDNLVDSSRPAGKMVSKYGGFIDEQLEMFDATYFNISSREAERLDPQQRMLLETANEAIEDSGIPLEKMKGTNTAVYVGMIIQDYRERMRDHMDDHNLYSINGTYAFGASGRVSFAFDLRGPAFTLDCACTTSLVGMHLAFQGMMTGDIDMALVGGAQIILDKFGQIGLSRSGLLSEDARCKFGDISANGYARSEGVGMILLKPLDKALEDGDNIHGVIKGTMCNNDGQSSKHMPTPSVEGQRELIKKVYKKYNIPVESIQYVEGHGTGTKVGDPIELQAVGEAIKGNRTEADICYIGSVKTNIGHTEPAAGTAGMIKTLLALKNRVVPPSLHMKTPNPEVSWGEFPFLKLAQEAKPFPFPEKVLRAGISSFGLSATNAHLIVEEAPKRDEKNIKPLDNSLFMISARNKEGIKDYVKKYIPLIEKVNSKEELHNIAASTAINKSLFEIKLCIPFSTKENLLEVLRNYPDGKDESYFEEIDKDASKNKQVFVFSGQGSHWSGMGKALFNSNPIFREAILECEKAYQPYVDWKLSEVIFNYSNEQFSGQDLVQPGIAAVSYALAKMWLHLGINPDAVVGHSMGEIPAACIAGILTLDEMALIVCTRSQLMKSAKDKGVVGFIGLPLEEVQKLISGKEDKISIGVINSKTSTVVSGDREDVEQLLSDTEQKGVFARKVNMDVAAHSHQMIPYMETLREKLQSINPKEEQIKFVSIVTGKEEKGTSLNADYWVKNLRQTVLFGDAILHLINEGYNTFFELSPHTVLSNSILENFNYLEKEGVIIQGLKKNEDDNFAFNQNLAKAYCNRIKVDWKQFYGNYKMARLPYYPWQKEYFWVDESKNVNPINTGTQVSISENSFYALEWNPYTLSNNESSSGIGVEGNNSALMDRIQSIIPDGQVSNETLVYCWKSSNDPIKDAWDFTQNMQEIITQRTNLKAIKILFEQSQIQKDYDINPASHAVMAITRTIRNEYPAIKISSVDIADTQNIDTLKTILTANLPSELRIDKQGKAHVLVLDSYKVKKTHQKFDSNSVHLISGGTSGLGLEYAKYLLSKGIGNIALVSRGGAKPETNVFLDSAKNANIKVYKADAAQKSEIDSVISQIENDFGNITHVVHAAGLLSDKPFETLTEEDYIKVFNPKVIGAQNLYQNLKNKNVQQWVFFSSAASIMGTQGQGNYVAANAFLDALSAQINLEGSKAISINWGSIAEIGMAAEDAKRGQRLEEQGLKPIKPNQISGYLDIILAQDLTQLMVADIDFETWMKNNPGYVSNETFVKFAPKKEEKSKLNAIKSSASYEDAVTLLKEVLREIIGETTKTPPSKIKEEVTLKNLGVDSLMAVQIKNKILHTLEANIPVSALWSYPTVDKLSVFLAEELSIDKKQAEAIIPDKVAESTQDDDMSLDDLIKELEDKTGGSL